MKNYANMFVTTAMAVLMLSGCSLNKYENVDVNGSEVKVKSCELSATVPQGWEVYRGEEMYKTIYETVSEYFDNAEDMRETNSEAGLQYVLFSHEKDGTVGECSSIIVKTMLKSSLDDISAAEYARECHDTSVIGYQSSGLTITDSGFEEREIGGKNGWLSKYAVRNEDSLVLGEMTFMYQHDERIVVITGTYLTDDERAEIEAAISSIGDIA